MSDEQARRDEEITIPGSQGSAVHGHEWARSTGRTMAANLVAVAAALRQHPLPSPG